jgi:hypothetical protein
MSEHPKLVISVESLHRVSFDIDIDLVVCDEIESILS